eukprot:CAMPEP_0118661026 /NCGR_PEP_ID=MMETSP0785-20121206/16036_1 /TAXON_ID=91992 /ORGANISM="Bolidomonas pacifica, Strain CCMP 1866" /LENGTH=211 /DNA_ID=CAMNT_0006554391 /DNA_START=157 /DNA_END=789 /DNA_ORIENTATION=-
MHTPPPSPNLSISFQSLTIIQYGLSQTGNYIVYTIEVIAHVKETDNRITDNRIADNRTAASIDASSTSPNTINNIKNNSRSTSLNQPTSNISNLNNLLSYITQPQQPNERGKNEEGKTKLSPGLRSWKILRRYSDFVSFDILLGSSFGQTTRNKETNMWEGCICAIPQLPGKSFWWGRNDVFLKDRCNGLQDYLNALVGSSSKEVHGKSVV